MISRIEVLNYKCLNHVSEDLQRFQVLVGPNGSGKSTLLDALVFLKDLLTLGVEQAVLKRAKSLRELTWKGQSDAFEIAIECEIPEHFGKKYRSCRYEIRVGVGTEGGIVLQHEVLWLQSKVKRQKRGKSKTEQPKTIVTDLNEPTPPNWRKVIVRTPDGKVHFYSETSRWETTFRIDPSKSALANLIEDQNRFPIAIWMRNVLLSIQKLKLDSEKMREPCRADAPKLLQPDGSNLPILVRELKRNDQKLFLQWLYDVKMIFGDVTDISVRERESDRYLYLEVYFTNGMRLPSWMLSDGMLHFLALTILPYLPFLDVVYIVERPENAIHPSVIPFVFQSLYSVHDGQVFMETLFPLCFQLIDSESLMYFELNLEGATRIVRIRP